MTVNRPLLSPSLAVRIRRKGWGDGRHLERIFEGAIRQHCADFYTPAQLSVLLATSNPRKYPLHFTLVAAIDVDIVGFCTLWGRSLQAMFVDPAYRGRGIGRQLLDAMEERARDRRITKLRVTSSLNAEGFYRACGYRKLQCRMLEYRGYEGTPVPVVEMDKALLFPRP